MSPLHPTLNAPVATETPRALGYRMPAEWEPHRATWLAWPHGRYDWPGKFDAIPWVFAEIARQLSRGEKVAIVVRDAAHQAEATKQLGDAGVDLAQIEFHVHPTNRSWVRDSLPTGVVRGEGENRELGAVKFRFNGWARYDNHLKDDAAGLAVADSWPGRTWHPMALRGKQLTRVVMEGGGLEVDETGTLLVTDHCLLSGPTARNRWLGKTGTEEVLKEYLGVQQVIWMPDGIVGDDTAGHVDDFVRFAPGGVVIVAQEPNPADANHGPLKAAAEALQGARNARGEKLQVVELPMPSPIVYRGERLPASYANFYIGNEAVIVPTFNDEKDRVALGLIAELFPGRRTVGIHCVDLVLGLGTLHCSSQQEPLAPASR